ncbi:MAG: hypothetical protein ACKVQT_37325 [Burkholderiales bacterium]
MPFATTSSNAGEHGFTYVGLLLFIVLASAALLSTATMTSTMVKRDREADLLFIGAEFRRAIGRYVDASPAAAKTYPRSLEDLVHDKRFPTAVRHLRKIYPDPMMNNFNWGIVKLADGGIVGVHSLSDGRPLKVGNFGPEDASLANKTRYSEWRFVHAEGNREAKPVAAATEAKAAQGAKADSTSPSLGDSGGVSAASAVSDQSLKPAIEPTRKNCELLVRTDSAACTAVRANLGTRAGDACIVSSNARVESCNVGQPVPPLDRGQ